jgi:uncharacterized membrane protein
MKHLKRSLKLPLAEVRTAAIVFFLIIGIMGFADASYLTIEHYRGVIPPCSATEGCEAVLNSPYSVLFGVPTSLLGAMYYAAVCLGAFIYLESKHGRGKIEAYHSSILKWTLMATALGFGMSLWFVYLQLAIIHSICIYCMGSATTSTILFITAIAMLRRSSKDQPERSIGDQTNGPSQSL